MIGDPGEMDQRVAIHPKTETQSTVTGEVVLSFTTGSTVWAKVTELPLDKEVVQSGGAIVAMRTIMVDVRESTSYQITDQVEWDGRRYDVVQVRRSNQRGHYMEILATETS